MDIDIQRDIDIDVGIDTDIALLVEVFYQTPCDMRALG